MDLPPIWPSLFGLNGCRSCGKSLRFFQDNLKSDASTRAPPNEISRFLDEPVF